jgi:cytochrome P450
VEQLVSIVGDLFVGGTETTFTALRWFVVFIIRNPEVQEKMRKEINDVIGHSRYPSMKDKINLPYTEAALHEVLRMGCIVPLSLPHGLNTDLKYKEFIIPKDVILIPNLYSILFDPDVFEDPKVFRPERFLDADGKLVNTEQVLTFSLGKNCNNLIICFCFVLFCFFGQIIHKMYVFLYIK